MSPFIFLFEDQVSKYLLQCRVTNPLIEKDTHTPPSPDETKFLVQYLRQHKVDPMIVGSVGVLRHLGPTDVSKTFRPTVDLDLWVKKIPPLPDGWKRDVSSIGVTSWISPSGGYVDFMVPNHEFPGGTKNPGSIKADPDTSQSDYPTASWEDIMRMKLNSMREKDLFDVITLVRNKLQGKVPNLGRLNPQQKENLDLVAMWLKARPQGGYGE